MDIQEINFFKANKPEFSLNGGVSVDSVQGIKNFKDTLGDIMAEMNEVTNKPEQLTEDLMQGKADVQDVMAAVAKSELTVQAATTITGKILQTYEKIMQIQI